MTIIVYSAISFIPTPGNSGAAELSFMILFTALNGSLVVSKYWAMAYWRFCCYFLIVLIGIVFIIAGMLKANHHRKEILKQEVNDISK